MLSDVILGGKLPSILEVESQDKDLRETSRGERRVRQCIQAGQLVSVAVLA